MLNANSNTTYPDKCKIVYNGSEDIVIGFKSRKAINNFVFNLGDELQFTGYANTLDGILGSDVIDDTPQTSTDYEFTIIKGLRCPGLPTVTDIDGNEYNTVLVNNQCWMKENLKTTTYKNGTPIPNVVESNSWGDLVTGAYIWYNNDISWKDKYGALYNWYAAVDSNGLCPAGWHVPVNYEWVQWTDYIGGGPPHGNEVKSCRQINSPLGGVCNTEEHPRWNEISVNYGTDIHGFSGLPSGYRNIGGNFHYLGKAVGWWSSTEYSSSHAWGRSLSYGYGNVGVGTNIKERGFSIRCIKD